MYGSVSECLLLIVWLCLSPRIASFPGPWLFQLHERKVPLCACRAYQKPQPKCLSSVYCATCRARLFSNCHLKSWSFKMQTHCPFLWSMKRWSPCYKKEVIHLDFYRRHIQLLFFFRGGGVVNPLMRVLNPVILEFPLDRRMDST